jgi:large subunit ribosomal protein L29
VSVRSAQAFALSEKGATLEASHLRDMSIDELQGTLDDLQKRLFELRSQAVTQKLENSKAIINTRRDVARVRTILREKSA